MLSVKRPTTTFRSRVFFFHISIDSCRLMAASRGVFSGRRWLGTTVSAPRTGPPARGRVRLHRRRAEANQAPRVRSFAFVVICQIFSEPFQRQHAPLPGGAHLPPVRRVVPTGPAPHHPINTAPPWVGRRHHLHSRCTEPTRTVLRSQVAPVHHTARRCRHRANREVRHGRRRRPSSQLRPPRSRRRRWRPARTATTTIYSPPRLRRGGRWRRRRYRASPGVGKACHHRCRRRWQSGLRGVRRQMDGMRPRSRPMRGRRHRR